MIYIWCLFIYIDYTFHWNIINIIYLFYLFWHVSCHVRDSFLEIPCPCYIDSGNVNLSEWWKILESFDDLWAMNDSHGDKVLGSSQTQITSHIHLSSVYSGRAVKRTYHDKVHVMSLMAAYWHVMSPQPEWAPKKTSRPDQHWQLAEPVNLTYVKEHVGSLTISLKGASLEK